MTKEGKTSNGDVLRRIYRRAGSNRFYLDLRDIGGGREALVEPGGYRATTDELVALDLAAKRVAELITRRREQHFDGVVRTLTVGELARVARVQTRVRWGEGIRSFGPSADTSRHSRSCLR